MVVVVLTLGAMARARGARVVLREYAALAVAGFLAEQTSIEAYRFYAYAPGWHLHVGWVPILVPLIWPLVILSAREVASGLWPRAALEPRGAWARACVVAAVVVFDASLVEVVAVRARLWSWAEPGHLAVPVIGILGWGFFAFGAELALLRARPALCLLYGPLSTHALVLASWWGGFRWALRGELGVASSWGVVVASAAATWAVVVARRRGGGIPLSTATPRMFAAALFLYLLWVTAPSDARLWAHVVCVAVPYLAATRFVAPRGRDRARD